MIKNEYEFKMRNKNKNWSGIIAKLKKKENKNWYKKEKEEIKKK